MTQTLSSDLISQENKDLVFNVSENDFVDKVVESSDQNLILVDFWAPWCGPCKQLSPILEEVIKDANGLVALAKINIDENKQLATQLRIQSIPTVIAFYNKKIADGFQGVLQKTKIIKFVEKILGKPFPKNKEEVYKKINDLIEKNLFDDAIDLIEDLLAENTNDTKSISLYIETYSNLGKFKDTKKFIDSLSDTLISDQGISKAIDKFKMLETASKEPSIEELLSRYNKQPDNIEALLKLCDKYFFEKQYEKAFELLFENYVKSKNKNNEKIKQTLLKYFDTLGNNHEQTKTYRRKLSSLLFS